MEFPIKELLDYERSVAWIEEYFHPEGFRCPNCRAQVEQAREFRQTERSQLTVYRCRACETAYNLYTGTVFQQRHLTPMQVVLLMRGICKGESSNMLAAELELDYKTVLELRHAVQANAEVEQPEEPLPDKRSETDDHSERWGKKVTCILTRLTHPAAELTNSVVTALMTMTGHQLSVPSVGKVAWCV